MGMGETVGKRGRREANEKWGRLRWEWKGREVRRVWGKEETIFKNYKLKS